MSRITTRTRSRARSAAARSTRAAAAAGLRTAAMRAAASDLIGRSLLAQELDLTFDGKRSLTAALGYKKNLTPKDYRDRFERGGIAGTIVEAMPVACWRGGGELVEDDDPDRSGWCGWRRWRCRGYCTC